MYKYYCLYNCYQEDLNDGFGELGHMLIINIGKNDCKAKIDIYYEDGITDALEMETQVMQTTESNWESWKITRKNIPFACVVSSKEPLICHVTIGWNNTLNDYSLTTNEYGFKVGKHKDYRECVLAYSAIRSLACEWYHPDGIQIVQKDTCWVHEKEWIILFNPNNKTANITFSAVYKNHNGQRKTDILLPAKTIIKVSMLELAEINKNYAAIVHSDIPIAAQWLRTVNWYDSPELMSYWSIPMQQTIEFDGGI